MSNEDVLNECLEAILRGETEESCLARYPEQAAELRPVLQTIVATHRASSLSPRPEYRARARYEYRHAVAEVCARSAKQGFRWNWRWSTAVPLAVAVVLMAGGGMMAASAYALPGQPLYEVKLMVEGLQIRFTPAGEDRTRAYALLAERRLEEITVLAGRGEYSLADRTSPRLESTLNEITSYLGVEAGWGSGGLIGTAMETFPIPSPDVVIAELLPPVAGSTDTSFSSVPQAEVDPVLLDTLQASAIQGRDKLLALMDEMPEDSRGVFWCTIESYEAILSVQSAYTN
ncbi:MAG: DUF5667 domain-containing protein [Dehalococcoidia bacterium]|nr:DUF5667 domain-containing protein [Dehalococcoidia bacterium]